jgi:hypothetical protein
LIEANPSGMEPAVGRMTTRPDCRCGSFPAFPQPLSGPVGLAVMPGRLDQQPPNMAAIAVDAAFANLDESSTERRQFEARALGSADD